MPRAKPGYGAYTIRIEGSSRHDPEDAAKKSAGCPMLPYPAVPSSRNSNERHSGHQRRFASDCSSGRELVLGLDTWQPEPILAPTMRSGRAVFNDD